jgi:hypothetical protein
MPLKVAGLGWMEGELLDGAGPLNRSLPTESLLLGGCSPLLPAEAPGEKWLQCHSIVITASLLLL